ncbi:MAG: PDZ domain-containing protein, partial [Acidobacteriota bacterium]
MTRSRFAFFLLSTAVVLPLLAGSLFGAATGDGEPGEDSLYKYLSVFTDSLGLVNQAYVEETEIDTLMAAALDGITDALDPMAVYVPEAAVPGYLQARDVGPAHSGLTLLRERGMIYVLTVQPASPADEAGIRQGDLIAELQGRSTRVMPLWEIRQVLGGAPGTEIDVQLVRFAETMNTSFTLRPFELERPSVQDHEGVPVLRIPSFEPDTGDRVEELLAKLPGGGDLVIDLRGTAGGDAGAAYEVAGLFAGGELGRLSERDT